jgi:hypothetical protein
MKLTSLPNNFDVLDEIVPKSITTSGLVVHLRLGDVIENHSRSVNSFLLGEVVTSSTHLPLSHHSMGKFKWTGSITGAGAEGSVKSAAYYHHVITKYVEDGHEKTVTLIGGTHKKINMDKSLQLMDSLSWKEFQHVLPLLRRMLISPQW